MDFKPSLASLNPSPLTLLDSALPHSSSPATPTALSRKRKHSTYSDPLQSDDDQDDAIDASLGASGRKQRPPGTKRACNQCRQQKLKCNVVESPWADCSRCLKHRLRCEITADFKRVGKRSQQAELERSNAYLTQKVDELNNLVKTYQERQGEMELYKDYFQRTAVDRPTPTASHAIAALDDDSHDAALLLNLKQSHDVAGPGARASPIGPHRRLGDHVVSADTIHVLWDEFFANYHVFLCFLDPDKDKPDEVFEKSEFLFWTIVLIASRHYGGDQGLMQRLMEPYGSMIKDTISRPPTAHYVVKALCLICTWPLPVSSSTTDMTFCLSGVMMKFAMHLGLHRPSNPMDFSRTHVQLKDEDISDRLKTWVVCNLVAQNISTGYGQPPETVYDSTLNNPLSSASEPFKYSHLHTRLELEKLADRVTRWVYSPQQHGSGPFESASMQQTAHLVSEDLRRSFETLAELSVPLNRLYASAVQLHLKLYVFFEEPSTLNYKHNLNELHVAAKNFLNSAFTCGTDLRFAPNYILQMMLAAAVALLKLLNSFFADHVDRDAGEQLFWDAISAIREMSVKPNDLPQRLAEVFAQMWKADAEKLEAQRAAGVLDDGAAGVGIGGVDLGPGDEKLDSSLRLKRRSRMSVSHVFDAIWRWKDELRGKVRAEKLEAAIKNPTSPQASSHRHSFSNGSRPTSLVDDASTLPGMTSFGGFGGLSLGGSSQLAFADSHDAFDPMGWYLDGLWAATGVDYP